MQKRRVQDAVGQVLCHDLTRIVPGQMKGPQFRKGHILREEDIPLLLAMGKEQVFVWEKVEGMLHEDEAALRLAALCQSPGIRQGTASEGKIELFAEKEGLFAADVDRLHRVNRIPGVIIGARHSYSPVKAGEKLAGMKVIPLVIPEAVLEEAEAAAGASPLFTLLPYLLKTAAVVTTGSEVAGGLIEDGFTPVVVKKLRAYGIEVIRHRIVGNGVEAVRDGIREVRRENPDLILCTGGMSVDPDDNTPGGIAQSGVGIVSYGAPVFPGAMFLLGYEDGGRPVLGLPGCVMYAKITVFDIMLPRIAAGVRLTREDFTVLGNGGLCLGCAECRYPLCPFGK